MCHGFNNRGFASPQHGLLACPAELNGQCGTPRARADNTNFCCLRIQAVTCSGLQALLILRLSLSIQAFEVDGL